MILLVAGKGQPYPEECGFFLTPGAWTRLDWIISSGKPWACDNGAFTSFNRDQYIQMLRRISGKPGLLWVTAPDIVGQAAETSARFRMWLPVLRYYRLPVAFVAQDGLEKLPVPWDDLDCLFIGGSTEWKLGLHAADLAREAKQRGKWVHMGRVNSHRRLEYAASIGCDSVDGTSYAMYRKKIPDALSVIARPKTLHMEGLAG